MARRRFRRRFRRRPRIPRDVVPHTRLVKVKSTASLSSSAVTTAVGGHTLNLNSLQDPYAGSGTGQPLFYDQIKTFYRTAIVVGARVQTLCYHASGGTAIIFGAYVIPYDTTTVPTVFDHFREMNWTGGQRMITPDIDKTKITHNVSMRKYFGHSNAADSDYEIDMENDGDPAKLCKYQVWIQPIDKATSSNANFIITLEQVVLLKDPFQPGRSTDV